MQKMESFKSNIKLDYGEAYKKHCYVCKLKIEGIGINDYVLNPVTNRRLLKWYHITCYTPRVKFLYYYSENDNPEIIKLLKTWNSQFYPKKIKKPVQLPFKGQNFLLRIWIQTFKFLTPLEVSKIAHVSKTFYSCSWNAEVWSEITQISDPSTAKIKKMYLKQVFNTCVACKDSNFFNLILSPLFSRCVCIDCFKDISIKGGSWRYSLTSIDYLLKKFRIDRCFFDRNKIPIFEDKNFCHKTYPAFIEEALSKSDSCEKQNFFHCMVLRKRQKLKDF